MEGPKHALEHLDRTLQTRIVRIANFEVVHADAPVICGEVHVIGVVVDNGQVLDDLRPESST